MKEVYLLFSGHSFLAVFSSQTLVRRYLSLMARRFGSQFNQQGYSIVPEEVDRLIKRHHLYEEETRKVE